VKAAEGASQGGGRQRRRGQKKRTRGCAGCKTQWKLDKANLGGDKGETKGKCLGKKRGVLVGEGRGSTVQRHP